MGFVLGVVLATSGHAMTQGKPAPNDPIVLLLKGIYQPATNAPNLGLPGVNLNDGTWMFLRRSGAGELGGKCVD
jgi:hypothetical protein